jgi:hypothetical protein
MGLDVNLYAEGEVTDEEFEPANAYLKNRSNLAEDWRSTGYVITRRNDEWLPGPRIELETMHRYWGPGYERGPWGSIYEAIRLMQHAFPACTVFYGNDSTDEGQECTEEMLAEFWEHFLGPNGDDYREHARAMNEKYAATRTVTPS